MTAPGLEILRAGPGLSLQDAGRPGYLDAGLSRGGAMDPRALAEGAALLSDPVDRAVAVEMAGMGGQFRAVGGDVLLALTGAPMTARIDGRPLHWPGSHLLPEGSVLEVGAARGGVYGYLMLAGGIDAPEILNARSAHLAAGIGAALGPGAVLRPAGPPRGQAGLTLTPQDRFSGGTLRILPSFQTAQFDADTLDRLAATAFRKDPRASRMGARMAHDGAPFEAAGHLDILSEVIVPGDIQIVGDGTPFVLLPECQTTGGYPRIATVISADLTRAAQAPAGAPIGFAFVDLDDALAARRAAAADLRKLPGAVHPLVRSPHDMADLLSYQLVDGVISAHHDHHED